MSTSAAKPLPAGHVVHLLPAWGTAGEPPQSLRLKPRLVRSARMGLTLLLTLWSAGSACAIYLLWTPGDSPGWWFSALFTVFIGGVALAFWAAYLGALSDGGQREEATARWEQRRAWAKPHRGVVTARGANTNDVGAVGSFTLTVRLANGDNLRGTWRDLESKSILQPQVPGVGSAVRVWREDGAAPTDPLVIEVLDPTVVVNDDAASNG